MFPLVFTVMFPLVFPVALPFIATLSFMVIFAAFASKKPIVLKTPTAIPISNTYVNLKLKAITLDYKIGYKKDFCIIKLGSVCLE